MGFATGPLAFLFGRFPLAAFALCLGQSLGEIVMKSQIPDLPANFQQDAAGAAHDGSFVGFGCGHGQGALAEQQLRSDHRGFRFAMNHPHGATHERDLFQSPLVGAEEPFVSQRQR